MTVVLSRCLQCLGVSPPPPAAVVVAGEAEREGAEQEKDQSTHTHHNNRDQLTEWPYRESIAYETH